MQRAFFGGEIDLSVADSSLFFEGIKKFGYLNLRRALCESLVRGETPITVNHLNRLLMQWMNDSHLAHRAKELGLDELPIWHAPHVIQAPSREKRFARALKIKLGMLRYTAGEEAFHKEAIQLFGKEVARFRRRLERLAPARPPYVENLSEFEGRLRYQFRDNAHLARALTSQARVPREPDSNELYECLGDSVLGSIVLDMMLEEQNTLPQARFPRRHGPALENSELAKLGRALGLEDTPEARREGITSDTFEALIGAIYLDGGYQAAASIVKRFAVSEDGTLFFWQLAA